MPLSRSGRPLIQSRRAQEAVCDTDGCLEHKFLLGRLADPGDWTKEDREEFYAQQKKEAEEKEDREVWGCCGECDAILYEKIPIECVNDGKGNEMTLCNWCWTDMEEEMRADGWLPDEERWDLEHGIVRDQDEDDE